MWSCGVWLYTVVVGAYSHGDAPDYRKPVRYPNWVQPTPELDDLIRRLLTVDNTKRATIEDIKTHPWFRKDFPDRAFQKNNPRKVADSNEVCVRVVGCVWWWCALWCGGVCLATVTMCKTQQQQQQQQPHARTYTIVFSPHSSHLFPQETEQLDALLRAASRRSSTGPGHHRRESSTSSYM